MVEIPRSTFNFDFEYERRILAEAEKENPNWSKFVVERQAPLPVPQQQASYIPPTFFHISVIFTWLPSDKVSFGSYLKKGLKLFMDLFLVITIGLTASFPYVTNVHCYLLNFALPPFLRPVNVVDGLVCCMSLIERLEDINLLIEATIN